MREIERAFAFAAKVEAQPLQDAAPGMATDALRLARPLEVETDWVSSNEVEDEQTGGKGSYPSSPRAGRIHIYRIARRLRGTGVAYGAAALPPEHALLKAILGSHNVDVTAGAEKVEYWGADSGEATLSLLAQTAAKQFKGLGGVPRSATIKGDAGGHLLLEVELVSVGQAPTQQALQAAELDDVVPPIFAGATWTLGGVPVKPITFTLDFGLSVSDPLLDGSASDAHAGYALTDRSPRGTMTIHVEDLATFDPFAKWASAEQLAWIASFGQTNYNRIKIEADRLEIRGVRLATRGGVRVYELDYKLNRAIAPSTKDPLISFIK